MFLSLICVVKHGGGSFDKCAVCLYTADKYQYTPWLDQPELIPKDPKYFMVGVCCKQRVQLYCGYNIYIDVHVDICYFSGLLWM